MPIYFVSQMNNKEYKWNTSSHFLSVKSVYGAKLPRLVFQGLNFVKYVEPTNKLTAEEKTNKSNLGNGFHLQL